MALAKLGYSNPNSSVAAGTVAALISYDLVVPSGKGQDRKIAVSSSGERIVRNAPDRSDLIKQAALTPPIHKEIFDRYVVNGKLADDDLLKRYLVWDREDSKFNEESVDPFIARFREVLRYAKLDKNDETDGGHLGDFVEQLGDPKDDRSDLQVGSFVQWTSNNVEQFKSPKKILSIDETGEWAFVEGSNTGIPMSELVVIETEKESPKLPPKSPFPTDSPPKEGHAVERTDLDEGDVILTLPKNLSPASVNDFEYWVNGVIQKLKRRSRAGDN